MNPSETHRMFRWSAGRSAAVTMVCACGLLAVAGGACGTSSGSGANSGSGASSGSGTGSGGTGSTGATGSQGSGSTGSGTTGGSTGAGGTTGSGSGSGSTGSGSGSTGTGATGSSGSGSGGTGASTGTQTGSSGTSGASSGSPTDAGASGGSSGGSSGSGTVGAACNGSTASTAAAGPMPPMIPAGLTVPSGFTLDAIAAVAQARELAALPNGDLLVATSGTKIFIIPNAEGSGTPGAPSTFATINDTPVQGVTFDPVTCQVFAAGTAGIYAMSYKDAQMTATPGTAIAKLRQGAIVPELTPSMFGQDTHKTTSVAVAGGKLYAGVGSGCNMCVETDPTRATVQVMNLDGSSMSTRATHFRNAIAVTVNPATGTVWAGGAGQDNLPPDHPYEFIDAVTLHSGEADYGWPYCEEDHVQYYDGGWTCANTVAPLVELPAYSTIIGATFYPAAASGSHAFPSSYAGGLFLATHGSWHGPQQNVMYVLPHVVFVPMNGDAPKTAVDWSDPTKQWTEFLGGITGAGTYTARPTGIAVGSQGSLFIADDQNGLVYRVRPN
jgi:glucose/arabinose dehydrogenase